MLLVRRREDLAFHLCPSLIQVHVCKMCLLLFPWCLMFFAEVYSPQSCWLLLGDRVSNNKEAQQWLSKHCKMVILHFPTMVCIDLWIWNKYLLGFHHFWQWIWVRMCVDNIESVSCNFNLWLKKKFLDSESPSSHNDWFFHRNSAILHWHFSTQTSTSAGYANKTQGNVAAISARTVNADSKTRRHLEVVHNLLLRLRCAWTTVITTSSASSSAIGRPSALMTKICDALLLGLISLCRRSRPEIPLKQWDIQLPTLGELLPVERCASWSSSGRGTSRVWAPSWFLPAAKDTSASFCFLMNVRCLQMGQTIDSLMFPSRLKVTRVLTRQSWQNTCPQLRVLSVPDRHS